MTLFDDAVKAADSRISLHVLDRDLVEGESIKTDSDLALEKTTTGLVAHVNGRMIHIDKALYGQVFVDCKDYTGGSALAKFDRYLSGHGTSPELRSILTFLLDLMDGAGPADQVYSLLKDKYDAIHVMVAEGNKLSITGELPVGCEVTVKRAS